MGLGRRRRTDLARRARGCSEREPRAVHLRGPSPGRRLPGRRRRPHVRGARHRPVRCWGDGANGRLGYGNLNNIGDNETPGIGRRRSTSARAARAVAIAVGNAHTCALLDNGTVRCWGSGANGRLGYGNTNDIGDNETPGTAGPVDLGAGRTAVAITAGNAPHLRAARQRHGALLGQRRTTAASATGTRTTIGDNETPGSVGPVDLGAGRTAIAITAGGSHTCAMLDNGTVRCWGERRQRAARLRQHQRHRRQRDARRLRPGRPRARPHGGRDQRRAARTPARCSTTARCAAGAAARTAGSATATRTTIGDNETPGSVGPVDLGAGRTAVAISRRRRTHLRRRSTPARCAAGAAARTAGSATATLNDIGDNETPGSVGPVDLGRTDGRSRSRPAARTPARCSPPARLAALGQVRCWGLGAERPARLRRTRTRSATTRRRARSSPVNAGGAIAVRVSPALSLTLKPKRDRRAAYRFKASGRLGGFLADRSTCSGLVTVRAKKGKRSVARKAALDARPGHVRATARRSGSSARASGR